MKQPLDVDQKIIMDMCGRITMGEYLACVVGIIDESGDAQVVHLGNTFACRGLSEAMDYYMSNIISEIGGADFAEKEDDE